MNTDGSQDNVYISLEEHKEIFEEDIIPKKLTECSKPSKAPRAIIVAGQPGSGKGSITAAATEEFQNNDDTYVLVDVDDLRDYHPAYRRLQASDSRTAAGRVQKDSGQWADELTEKAIEDKHNLIIDGTLKSPDKARKLCQRLREAGYDVEIRVMAVHSDVSTQGIYARYEDEKAKDKLRQTKGDLMHYGRWVPEDVHDAAYAGVVESIREIHETGVVDRISVYGRDPHGKTSEGKRPPPKHISTTSYSDDGSDHDGGADNPFEEIKSERIRKPTSQEQEAFDKECNRICDQIRMRDSNLVEPENKRAIELNEQRQQQQGQPEQPEQEQGQSIWDNQEDSDPKPDLKPSGASAKSR